MADEAALDQGTEEILDFTEGVEGEEAAVAEAEAAEEEAPAEIAENGTAANGTGGTLSADDPMAQPPHGTEVFVGGVPRMATEEQLTVFASEVGEVHGVTLLREPQNPEHNRGFGFIKYKARDAARAALDTLGGKQMADFPGQALRVAPSQSKHKLYVGNIPKELTRDTLKEQISAVAKGVEAVDILMSKDFPGQNRGFAFVEFYNHACALAAKNALSAPGYTMGGRPLNVAFAEPKQIEQQQQPAQPKVIYVGNLPNTATETNLKELFDTFSGGEVTKVVIPPAKPDKPNREFGFIHFAEKETVDKLISGAEQGTKPEMDGKSLEIKAAKPQVFPDQQQGFGGGRGGGFGGGRGFGGPRGRGGGFAPRGRGRGGFGGRGGGYNDFKQGGGYGGYDEWGGGYGGYEEDYGGGDAYMGGGHGGGYEEYGGGYDGGYDGYGAAAGAAGGMAMVPMMLPNGQVGYVLQGGSAGQVGGGYGGGPSPGGPLRSGGRGGGYSGRGGGGGPRGGRGGRGGGFGGRRYQPY
ncbi:hypothetical protein CVIRNUC_006422 [Coccomyxa viridis]|uniref:RRM domain-containing protein n=1 Tax=Coccomyxa viridis TaxID=1274662 RepID=A0AAV1IBL6_9CHLO|nr:hypothetical protein CVIRNUC_006422 [Coccomyxa viridis]